MAGYDEALDKLDRLGRNPAAPAGLRQRARAEASEGYAAASQQLQSWTPDRFADQAQDWYTGANNQGTRNGWNNDFVKAFTSGWDQALQDGEARTYFERDDATGVVLWDHESEDGLTRYRFGDIYEDGRKVGNVYDQAPDRATANLLLLPWLGDGTTQRRLFEDPETAAEQVDKFVQEKRQTNNDQLPKALAAAEFEGDVKETQEKFQEGAGDELLAGGGGAVGGAITGAGTGALLTAWAGPGAAVGAVAGGLIGGVAGAVGGLLNKDEIAQQAARAHEITELAFEENGRAAGFATAAKEYAQLSTKLTSPLQNLSKGITDAAEGDVGDGVSARYAVDAKGESTAPLWAKVADWTALAGDSLMQFASPLNRAIYTAQMSTAIAGESAQLALTGEQFDPREGGFDNIFLDDDGRADPLSAAAGIAKIGIDAIQIGGLRGLAGQAGRAGEAVRAGGRVTEASGMRFILNEAGQVTGRKKTLALLAPSEQIAYWSTARAARVAALKEGRAVSADDFYRAANDLANGSRKLKTAVVNAFGEGYEEAAQSVLEPLSMDGRLDLGEIGTSFLYGAGAGLGLSLGATFAGPAQDARLSAQAYALETIRRGEEPDREQWDAEWAGLSDAEKRVRLARTPAQLELVRSARERVIKQQAATLVASEADAAKAVDARNAAVEKELKTGTGRTDMYTVMTGILDAGRVDENGTPLGDTLPADAFVASARTVHDIVSNRLTGMRLQVESLTRELAALPEDAAQRDDLEQRLAMASASEQVGTLLTADLERFVNRIYDENTTEEQARSLTRAMNGLLRGAYDRSIALNAPDGWEGSDEQLRDAAAHFVTQLQSREPKLDTGSYLALLPQADWTLTRERSDNFIQVNVDVLQAINGDFDGDKLHAENQLSLSAERYAQARAGQFFSGAGRDIDIAERNFEEALTQAVGDSLAGEPGQLRDEAEATLAKIESAVSGRYGELMSPAALAHVLEEFRTATRAGSAGARLTLVNGLAREAGQAITDLGRAQLHNEWLWVAKVVRANFEAFQSTYSAQLAATAAGPSDTVPVEDFDTPEGVNRRKDRAATPAQTLALWAEGSTLFRQFQKIHYTLYNSSVLGQTGTEQADLYEMAQLYEELGRGVTRSELTRVSTDDTVAGRVLVMLDRLVTAALRDPKIQELGLNPGAAMTVLANIKVKDVQFVDGEPVLVDGGQDLSLVQLLLKRALDADRAEHANTFAVDEKLQAKHARLRALTVPNAVNDDVNAERAYVEVFKAVPFDDSLGGITGALAPHTTPEQWLRNYISLDATGRQAMEREFTNVPEYLDRKKHTNPPYTFSEAANRELTPYRAMLDALMATGRATLTFDPTKPAKEAFGGDMAQVNARAQQDFQDAHGQIRDALRDYRTMVGRRAADLGSATELVQEMLQSNPMVARQVLALIPDAATNALFDYRDGELYIAPWIYEMFTIEDSREALFFYWKNLTLAQWNSTLQRIREDDGHAAGRQYHKLQSRFQRLLYRLAREPGQLQFEQLLVRMDQAKDLDEFFVWLNDTPGFRGQEAVYLPFHDDVADFEADAGGGWVTIKAGSDLRSAITALRRGARSLAETMAFRQQQQATDRLILDGIKRAQADDPDATPEDRENLRRLTKAVAVSRELPRGFAPSAMLALTHGAIRGFDAQSHDKGRTATSYGPLGEFQALMDAFGFVPGLERVMETLTAHSMSSLRTNVGDMARYDGVAMDADGRPVEWQPMSVEQAIEMLDDPRSAPLAHALLTPTALDLSTVGMTERLLTEASLAELLDDGHYKQLFAEKPESELNQAMRYLSLVDAKARAEGGSFDAIRYANDLAATMTSGLGRPATDDDLARLRDQAYIALARALKMVGQVQASPDMRKAGTMAALRKAAVEELRRQRLSRALPGFTDATTDEVLTSSVEAMVEELKLEQLVLVEQLAETYSGEELDRHSDLLTEQYDRNEERLRALLDDDIAATTVARFRVTGDAVQDRAAHGQIVDYVRTMTSFPARAPEAADAWTKLAGQLNAGRTPDLTASEWESLSHGAMGVWMVDQALRVASHVALPPFPKGDPAVSDARFYKYFDPNFTYLATDLLQEDSPLTRAAVWLHTAAGQPATTAPLDKLTGTLFRTVLDRRQFGAWTPGLMSQITEAHKRMDSAAAGQAIAAAGNGPKRQAVIAAATRRTGAVPTSDLLTTVSFTGEMLSSRSNLITVQPAGSAEATTMPTGMLDNRFYASIKLDGFDVLEAVNNLGFRWDGADEPNPYRYVALERLMPVLEQHAASTGKSLAEVQIEVEFFHPDSAPVGAWNNAFFEGMSHSLLPDGAESLVATLWSDNGGMISTDTQRPLDAGKKGLLAIQPFRRLDPDRVAEADALWERDRDFAAMLRRKTELIMGYDDGSGTVDPSYFNAVYKHMKLQHLVATPDGQFLSAEEAIALQAQEGRDALNEMRLVRLSPDVVRSMLGDTGSQGVERFFDDEYLVNPDRVAPYEGISERARQRFGAGWMAEVGSPAETSLAHIGQQRVLTVRSMLTDQQRNVRQERVNFLNSRSAEVRAARYAKLKGADARDGYLTALQLAQGAITSEKATFDFGALNAGVLAPRDGISADHSIRLLEAMKGIAEPNEYSRGWKITDEGLADYPGGELTVESLNDDRPLEHQVVKDDLAVVLLNTFQRPELEGQVEQVHERVEKALRYLANSGATVALGAGNGSGDLRFHAAQYLQELGYEPVAGSKHLYRPVVFSHQTQNQRAYESTLLETQLLHPARNAVTFLAIDPIGTDENSAILNPASTKLRARKVLNNILPSAAFPNFNLPMVDTTDGGLYARTLQHLRRMTDPGNQDARKALLKMGGGDPKRVMPLRDALDRFHRKITESSSLVPEAGDRLEVGDIVPFVHPDGRVLLYRHGFKLPDPEKLDDLLATDGMNVAVAPSETEPAATANSGVVRAVENRAGYGRVLQLEVPLQPYGDKVQLEWNGMKYVLAPPPDGLGVPQLFSNGAVVDLLSDVKSADSKEAFGGRIRNYRDALAFFQFDFTDDLVRFFLPNADPAEDASSRVLVYNYLDALARQADARIPFSDAHALAKANVAVADLLGEFVNTEADRTQVPSDWLDRLQSTTSPEAAIARAMVTYLLTPGAHVDNVLRSAGFSHPRAAEDGVQVRKVPGLFADLLDQGLDSELHTELIRRFDAQLYRGPNGEGFRLHPDWTVEMFTADGKVVRGYLQYGEAHSSGDNPLLDGQAFDVNAPQAVSPHNTLAANLSTGAITTHKTLEKSTAFARSFSAGAGVIKPGADGESVWQMLTALPNVKDDSLANWRRETPAETLRRAAAREEIVGFYRPLNTEDWSEPELARYQREAVQVLEELNLYGSQRAMVDTWVRMQLGRPYGLDEAGGERGVISFEDVMETVAQIRRNVRQHLLPVAGANVPLLDVNHLTTIYLANLHREDGWAPVDPATGEAMASWDSWVDFSLGTAFRPEADFDQLYLLAVDGMMHGYQHATTSTRYLPVSSDTLRNHMLIDAETNRRLVSISSDENLLATDPTLFDATHAELEEIISGQRIYAPGREGADPASAKGRQKQRVQRWRKEVDAPRQAHKSMRGVRQGGQTFVSTSTKTSGFFRGMMDLRVGNTLFNPALWVSAPFEAFVRRSIDSFSNALTGEGTGAVGRAQTRLTEMFADTKIGAVAAQLGLTPTFTSEQLDQLQELTMGMASRPEFKSMVYKELMYQYPSMPGIGKVGKALESYAKFGARMQDPAWGMLPRDLARIYLTTVVRKMSQTNENIYSVDRLLVQMARDPQWVQKNDLEAHNLAIAAISQVRSVKPNVLSLAVRGAVEPLSENPNFVVNASGNLLKVLTAFQNFWANFGTSITGLQGAVDFMAFWFDGRQKKITARAQAALRGERYNETEAEFYDMSEVLESLDLADSFIRGGVTHSALFTLGMLAGGLGLSGEDDEQKWRRRQAELQGVPVLYDPREIQNDFRNKDSIFLDWLPWGMDALFRVDPSNPDSRAMAQMNWVTRTFLSPIIGFERFYETGDFTEVIHGFKDAVGSHPIVNQTLWNEATDTAAYLHEQANGAAENGDPITAGHSLMTAVGVLESMLFENSMVNLIYIGMDEYDRDPYVLPLRDSDGELQRDITGQARPNDVALSRYYDQETETIGTGFLGRSDRSADAHVLTENRATMAFVASLFSGGIGDSDFWRYNMPVKTRTIAKPKIDQEEAEALVKAALVFQLERTRQPSITPEEMMPQVRNALYQLGEKNGHFYTDEEVWKVARAEAARRGSLALSVLDDSGREQLTTEGAKAVFRGLRHGTMEFGDAALAGVYIPYEMREKISAEWSEELVREGMQLGLDETKARSRMKRIMSGPLDTPEVPGLGDLLWSKDISYSENQTYLQHNTSYVMGPDGRPWATGFKRDNLLGALGLQPLKTMIPPVSDAVSMDGRGNTVDLVNGINTGLRALEPIDDSRFIPTDKEIADQITKAIEDAAKKDYTPFKPWDKDDSGGNGWVNFGRGYGGYGGGGYGSAYFTKMYSLMRGVSPYGNSIQSINSSNPYIRRAFVRRERIASHSGRLKQWQ